MDVVDLLILALRLLFVVLLYLFLFAVLRLAISGLRAPAAAAQPEAAQRLRLQVIEPGDSGLSSGQILEASGGSSKPAMARSFGTSMPRRWATAMVAAAMSSVQAKIAVG